MKSGIPGIYWHKSTRTGLVRNWQDVHIATFDEDDLETAKLCRAEAERVTDVDKLKRKWQRRLKPRPRKSLLNHPCAVKLPWGQLHHPLIHVRKR